MRFEDLKKLATSTTIFNLRRVISPRLVTIGYLLGLVAIALWAIDHFFYSFRFGFGNGLWGLLEIAVFGLLGLVALRIVCEAVIVYFKAHEDAAAQVTEAAPRSGVTLIDDVRDAIEDLVDQEPEYDETENQVATAPVEPSASPEVVEPVTVTPKKRSTPKNTATE